jgi:outer membrane receptor protein involved in Fe transport
VLTAVRGRAETATPVPSGDQGPAFYAAPTEAGGRLARLDTARTAMLSQRITLDLHGVTIPQALAAIAVRSGLRFAYHRAVLPARQRVTVAGDEMTVAGALTQVLRGADVDVELGFAGLASIVPRRAAPDLETITGRVTDTKTGQGLAHVSLLLEGVARGATTSDSGTYRITDVAPGSYTLVARLLGYVEVRRTVVVAAGQPIVVDVALEQSANKLDQVVVAGTVVPTEVKALPTPISVITASDIELQRPQTVVQLFRQAVPSAVAWDYGIDPEQTTMSVRGGSTLNIGSGSMKVYLDGIEITDETFAAIDPASIDRIEVIRGPQAATIYGSGAISGVMLVTTKHGSGDLNRPRIDFQVADGVIQSPYAHQGGGDAARQQYTGSINGGSTAASYNIGGGYVSSGNWVAQGGTASPSAYGGVHFEQGSIALDVSGRDFIQHTGDAFPPVFASSGLSSFEKPNNDASTYEEQTYGASLVYTPTRWWRQNLTIGIDRAAQELRTIAPVLTTPADTLLDLLEENESKATIAYNTSIQVPISQSVSTNVTAGVDHYNLDNDMYFTGGATNTVGTIVTVPAEPVTASRTPITNTGVFAQAQLDILDRLFLTTGVRAERNSAFGQSVGTPVLPRFGVSYAPSLGATTLKLRASYGAAIRPPAALEQDAFVGAFLSQLANPLLRPERQSGWDTGLDLVFGSRGSISATYFDQYANDLINGVTVVADSVPQLQQYQNIGRVHNTGIELEGSVRLPIGRLSGQYAIAGSRVDALGSAYGGDLQIGDQLLGIPRHTGGLSLAITPLRTTTVAIGVSYVGSWTNYNILAEEKCFGGTGPCFASTRGYWQIYPAFTKANVSVTQRITSAVSGFVSITNLTNNEDYEFLNSVPIMGRVTVAGIQLRY